MTNQDKAGRTQSFWAFPAIDGGVDDCDRDDCDPDEDKQQPPISGAREAFFLRAGRDTRQEPHADLALGTVLSFTAERMVENLALGFRSEGFF